MPRAAKACVAMSQRGRAARRLKLRPKPTNSRKDQGMMGKTP
jgi:hypothetical protein